MEKIHKFLRLKDTHPTMVKLNRLIDLASELGISISYSDNMVVVSDKDRDPKLPHLFLQDLDSSDYPPSDFPPIFDFKIIYDNPEYLENCDKIQKEECRKADEARKVWQEKVAAEQREAIALLAKQKENEERLLLTQLKEKYEK